MQIKKLTYILILILLGASGLLSGCKTVYDRMRLELSTQEIELFLPLENGEEEVLNEAKATFTATVSNVPKHILKSVTYQSTNTEVISVSMGQEREGQTEIEVTALRPGRTNLIVKTTEGNKSKAVAILVLKRVEDMTLNPSYSLAVTVGSSVSVNTAQAIQFYPANTNQKDIRYELSEVVQGVTITEAGLITVTEKTTSQVTVIATNIANENLSVTFNVTILDPVKQQDILLTTPERLLEKDEWVQGGGLEENFNLQVSSILMANNHVMANSKNLYVQVNSSENYRVTATSSNNDIVEIVQIDLLQNGMQSIFLRANNLGQITITVKVEIVGYEHYYATKSVNVSVANFATSVLVGGSLAEGNETIYNNYSNMLGKEIKVDVAPTTAYSKQIRLFVEPANLHKITIKYSDGTIIPAGEVNNTILPRGMSVFVYANVVSSNANLILREQENTVELLFIANSTISNNVQVTNKAVLKLTQGATNLNVPPNLSLQMGLSASEYPSVPFLISPIEAMNDNLIIEVENTSIVDYQPQGSHIYKIIAKNAGNTRIFVTTSNGIQKIINVEVYVPLDNIALQIESPAQNHNIAVREMGSVPNEPESVIRATMVVGAGIHMNTLRYPNNASVESITYSSSSTAIATINNNGYILARAIGTTTITVTVVSKEFLDSETSTTKTTVKTFELTTYIPIKQIDLNALQVELYDQNTLGYFDLGKSMFQFSVAITPNNATFNQQNILWSTSSEYITVENGLVRVNIPIGINLPNNTFVGTVTATILEFNRYYAKTAVITVRRAVKVESISIFNIPQGYVYFDAREGVINAGTKQLNVQTYPYIATNSNLRYVYVKDAADQNINPVFSVNAQGLISPLRAGIAKLHVVAEDSYINENTYIRYNEVIVKVADGLTEETALEIYSANDIRAIDTVYELGLHYVLANNIDFLNQPFTPIGLIGGTVHPFTGSINGQFAYAQIQKTYQIKGLSFVSNHNLNYYSGFVANNSGTLKNLKIELSNWNIVTTNNAAGSVGYFGGVSAINNGIIQNVTISVSNIILNNAILQIASRTAYVGLISAQNNANIINSVAYGQFEVKEYSSVVQVPLVYVGGMVGINTKDALLEGVFVPANKLLGFDGGETTYSNENVLYQKEGINAYANITTALLQNINNTTGGAVGYNIGLINKLATDGIITAKNNAGGMVGLNIGQVSNSYSASQVTAKNNVGGLIGYATLGEAGGETITSKVMNNAVEIYDRKNTYEQADIIVKGVNNVGGLIGYADALNIFEYNYVNSYVLREIGENYSGDIVLLYEDQDANFVMGGLIGKLENVNTLLDKNFANVNLATIVPETTNQQPVLYAGGFIGHSVGNFNIENAYTKANIVLPLLNSVAGQFVGYVENATNANLNFTYSLMNITSQTTGGVIGNASLESIININNDNYLVWDFENSTVWFIDSSGTINGGYPVLYNAVGNLLINEAPQEVNVIIENSSININYTDNSISFNHLKVNNKQAVVLLKEQPYSIRDLIATSPNNARYYLTTENTDIIEILDNGSIRTLKEGTATIRVSSVLNKNIFDTFELAIVKGFTNFSLSKTQGINATQLTLQDIVHLKLQESVVLYSGYSNNVGAVGNYVGATYTATAGGFTVNNLTLDATLNNITTHIISAGNVPSSGNILVTVTPHIKVVFGDGQIILPISELRKQFYVSIYEGASSVTTSMVSATIGLTEEIMLEVYVVTDKLDEQLSLQFGQLDQDETGNINDYIEAITIGSEVVLDEQSNYLYNVYRFKIKAKENFLKLNLGSGNFKSAKSGIITITPQSNELLSSQFHITITPQDLLRIDMAHFPTGETQIESGKAVYYPRELPSNIISPAQPGILKVNLYPEYANIDYYQIISSVNSSGQFVSLEQVALISNVDNSGLIDNIAYSAVVPSPLGIPYGTTLNLISSAIIENNVVTNIFDGNIFIKTLISSAVQKGQTFTLTITGYRVDESGVSHAQLSKQITLLVDNLPGITLLYKGERTGYVERGTRVPLELYVTENYSGVLREPVATYVYGDTDGGNSILSGARHIYVEEDENQKDKFYLVIGHGVPSGTTIQITAKVERTINGILEKRESSINLQVVNFLVERIVIENTTTNGTRMNMYVGERTQLQVGLRSELFQQRWNQNVLDEMYGKLDDILIPATQERIKLENIKNEILAEIEYLEKMFSRNINTWYERQGPNLQIKTGLEENTYLNYLIYRKANLEEEYAYSGQKDVFVGARRVSNSSVLGAEIKYYYNADGRIQPILLQNNTWVKYPQINQPENMQEANLSFEEIQKIKVSDAYFTLNITPNSTEDKPIPIYDEQEFRNMQPGVDYILLNEEPLVLENWLPINTAIRSLDGNNRVIKIKSFASNLTQGTFNFGLFGTINENTVLKNLQIDIGELINAGGIISATEFNEVNFGFIAGINYGTINNADIFNSSTASNPVVINSNPSTNVIFGTLVGQNLGGYITNSRVGRIETADNKYPIAIETRGIIGGFVGYNTGVITSSYVANLKLTNTSLVLQNSRTGGFVATNSNRGRISLSFVEGIQSSLGQSTTNPKVIQQGGLYSIGNIGGFVFENQGIISDSYSNIPIITESRSAGFVYQNASMGSITNAYSLSKIAERSLAHLPFVGSNSLEELLNFGNLTNTYYISNPNYFTTQFGQTYPAVAVTDFSYSSNFNGFGFLNEIGYQKYGAWEISSSHTRPIIPSSLQVTISERMLVDTRREGGAIVEYFYTEVDYAHKKGTASNPILVASAKQFLEAMTMSPFRDPLTNINNKHVRLIKDIDFNEILNIDETAGQQTEEENRLKLANLQRTIFVGKLDGNGMTLKNVRVLSSIDNQGLMQESFGMFNRLGYEDEQYVNLEDRDKAVIKNLNIEVAEISATEAISVGVLAGEILNSIVLNVNITGQNITVQGRNLVGGLAGRVAGDSRIINITSSLSVNSEFRTTNLKPDGVTLDYLHYNGYNVEKNEVSYAGGIVGVLDLYTFDDNKDKQQTIDWMYAKPKVEGLVVKNNLTVRAEKTGGVIGYIGPFTYVKNALFEINHIISTQTLVGSHITGGVVAENSGLLDHSRIQHEINYQLNVIDKTNARVLIGYQNLIQENSQYVGGLVGYNNMGIITDSYSRLDIVNTNAHTVGGLVGVNYAGSINRVYATGHLSANNTIGGLIGVLSDESLQTVDENGVSNNQTAIIKNAFAVNNWQLGVFQNINKDTLEDSLDGAWRESDGTIVQNKYIGAFIGKVQNQNHLINIERSWYIDEVFSVLGEATIGQTKKLREAGNITFASQNNVNGVSAVVGEGKTQFATITDLNLVSTQDKYSQFASVENPADSLWTLNSSRFPQLRFRNISDIRLIETEDELENAIREFPSSTIIVGNDIYLTRNWTPMPFRGTIVGKEVMGIFPTIYNININNSLEDTGFFSILSSANVSNLNFVFGGGNWVGNPNGVISTAKTENSSMGILAGTLNNSAIKNVHIRFANADTSFASNAQYTGLIAGKTRNIIIENVSAESISSGFNANLTVEEIVLPQDNYLKIYVGGAFGQIQAGTINEVSVKNLNIILKTNSYLYLGGFAGRLISVENMVLVEANVNLEVQLSSITENAYIGGFIGETINANIIQGKAYGTITSSNADNLYVGGFIGYSENATLEYVIYENTTTDAINVIKNSQAVKTGGLIGYAENTFITNSNSTTNIMLKNAQNSTYVGGLIGHSENTENYLIKLSYAKVNIDSTSQGFVYAGGLIGQNLSVLEEVYSQGILRVSSTGALRVGGLIGVNNSRINYSVSMVRILANSNAQQEIGGLIGRNLGDIRDSYIYGTIYTNKPNATDGAFLVVNPMVGKNMGGATLTRVHFNKDIIGLTERSQYLELTPDNRHNKSHTELLATIRPEQQDMFIKQSNSYPYLKNLDAPNISAGSLINPIRINSALQFSQLSNENDYYVQQNDITYNMSSYSAINNFNGVYNAGGFKITYTQNASSGNVGLFNSIGANGIIANLGVIANLQLDYNGSDTYSVGGLAVQNNGTIYKSCAKTQVTLSTNRVRRITFGGLVSYNYSLIEHSFAVVDFNGYVDANAESYLGGLVGRNLSNNSVPTINTSFATGRLLVKASVGTIIYDPIDQSLVYNIYASGFAGLLSNSYVYNSYSSTVLQDEITVSNVGLYGRSTGANTIDNSYHDIYASSKDASRGKTTVEMTASTFIITLSSNNKFTGVWVQDKTLNSNYPYPSYHFSGGYNQNVLNTGNGTHSHPYLISHAGRLDWIRQELSNAAYFKQTNDINLQIYNSLNNNHFEPIGNVVTQTSTKYGTSIQQVFSGFYDGQNYIISNLKQAFTGANNVRAGLFGALLGGVSNRYGYVYNLNLRDINIAVNSNANMEKAYLGGIAGIAEGAIISNSSVTGEIKDNRDNTNLNNKTLHIGGLVAYIKDTLIQYSYANLKIQAAFGHIGGLVGRALGGNIYNSYHDGEILLRSQNSNPQTNYYVGGIVGHASVSVSATVLNTLENLGTIIIDADNWISSSIILSADNLGTGGIVGYMSGGYLINVVNKAHITFEGYSNGRNMIAGIAGNISNIQTVTKLRNEGNITIKHWSANINGTLGGISEVEGTMVGGIIGYAFANANRSMSYLVNTGNINVEALHASVEKTIVGGIIATAEETSFGYNHLSYSFNEGAITVKSPSLTTLVGGIMGHSNIEVIEFCFNTGAILVENLEYFVPPSISVSSQYVGGIVGHMQATNLYNTYNQADISLIRASATAIQANYQLSAGGIVGYSTYKSPGYYIRRVYNTGNITAENYKNSNYERAVSVGGIAGTNSHYIYNAYNTGNIAGYFVRNNNGAVGGITGRALGTEAHIEVYNTGLINVLNDSPGAPNGFTYYRGQIIGTTSNNADGYHFVNQQIIDTLPAPHGGFQIVYMGSYGYVFDHNALTYETAGHNNKNDAYDNGHTLAAMKQQATYLYWNFTNTWTIIENVSTPQLRNMPVRSSINNQITVSIGSSLPLPVIQVESASLLPPASGGTIVYA